MAIENKRVIDLATESTSLAGDEYVLLDSNNTGTTKYRLSRLSDEIDEGVGALGARIDLEATARQSADEALEQDVTDLKDDLSELNETIIKKNYIEGYYISKAGQLVADPDYCVTEKIYMTPEMNNSGVFWYGTYDAYKTNVVSFTADDTMVDYWGGTRNVEYRAISNFGANVAYIRFTFDRGYVAKFTSSFSSDNTYTTYWQAGETNAIDTIKKNDSIYASSIIGKEGMKKTENDLIHIGQPIPFEAETFFKQLRELMDAAYRNKEIEIRSLVEKAVPTYHPERAKEI